MAGFGFVSSSTHNTSDFPSNGSTSAISSITANAQPTTQTTNGSLLVVMVKGIQSAFNTPSAISVAMHSAVGGLTWQQAGSTIEAGYGWVACFYALNAPVVATSNYLVATITVANASGAALTVQTNWFEFSPPTGGAAYDTASAGGSGNNSTPSCGSISPAASGGLIIASVIEGVNSITPPTLQTAGSGYTIISSARVEFNPSVPSGGWSIASAEEYVLSCSAGAQTPAFGTSSGTGGKWEAAAWAFKAAISSPTVTSCSPSSGCNYGGTSVTIGGTGFVSGCTVKINGVSATSVVFGSSSSLTCVVPAGTVNGAVNIVVTNPDTGNGTDTNGFTYTTPPNRGSFMWTGK